MCPWLVLTPYLRPARVVLDSPRIAWEDPLEKEIATLSGTLAWKTPWTEERGRLSTSQAHMASPAIFLIIVKF